MKVKIALILCAILLCVALFGGETENEDVLRIHIRANSDSQDAQRVKYEVKDAVVAYLTPILARCDSMEKVRLAVSQNMTEIIAVADAVLIENAVNYRASARLCMERFPARSYDGRVYGEGVYESLIIELGEGAGENWWCVLYPPLCFVPEVGSGGNVVYRSKILEIINQAKRG